MHDWVVYHLGGIFGSVGHRVKIHKITPATGKKRDDLEIKDYVVLQKPQEQTDHLPPPRTLVLYLTLTNTRYFSSHVHTTGQLTNTRRWLSTVLSQKSIRWPRGPNDPDLGCATSARLPNCGRWMENPVSFLSVCFKGTLAIGRLNLMPRSGLEPTVRIDICETQSLTILL